MIATHKSTYRVLGKYMESQLHKVQIHRYWGLGDFFVVSF